MRDELDLPGPSIKGRGRPAASGAVKRERLARRERMLRDGSWMSAGLGRCLAFDLGTETGVAQYDGRVHGQPDCVGVREVNLSARDGEGAGARPLRFERVLEDLLDGGGPVTWVAYERVHAHLGTQASHVYGQLMGVLMLACEKRGIVYRAVPVSLGKFAATGNGGAPKDIVHGHVHEHFRPVCRRVRSGARLSHNETDALSILMAALMGLD